VAALLAGRLTRGVQRGLLDLGLDEVDIQPELLARETNPGARFTFGKNITPDMKLIFSRGLRDPESTFYQLEYRMRALYDVTARVQSDDHASITYGLGQRFRFGAPKKPKSELLQEKRVMLKAVRFSGEKPLGEDVLRDAIKAKVGDDATPWDIQDDADRLERLLVDAQYIEALVSARIEDDSAVFAISAGPRYRAEVVGMPQAPPLETTLKEARFEGEALDRGRKLLLEDARKRGYGRAKLDAAARDDPGWRTLSFKVELGAPTQVTVSFPGARALPAQRLLTAAGGAAEFLAAPQRARRLVAREYRAALYLGVRVGEPEVTESADHASVSIAVPVQEGAKAKIARVRFDGAQTPESVLVPLTGIAPGSDYLEEKVLRAVQQVREYYLKNGYAAVRLRHQLVPAAPDVELHFQINEGERDTIGPVVVSGLRRTRESLVRNRINFKQGEPLDPRKLVELERRLMELGMFSRVAVSASGDNPRTIKVEVEERGPYMVNYDLRFSQDERATVLVDGEIGNLGGLGIVAGARYRQGLDVREARGSLVLPALGRARGITLSAFDREQQVGLTGEPRRKSSVGPFESRTERGAGLQHSLQLRNSWETAYSYTLKRVGTTAGGGLQKNLGILEASIVSEGRDDPLNPSHGVFWSVNLGLSPKALGSQLPFSRVMGQVSVTLPVGRQLTWAQGYRIGVASVLKGKTLEEIRLIGRSEGFRAGGGSSVRGYATDSLGPRDLLPGTAAGDAVAIVNQELRYQLPAGFGAAVFYDAGNVFARKEDLTLKLRQSVGVGVRYLSPFGLVRVDVGFPMGRRPGEKPQIFLSLGQAF
jgi:outer membrane protein assembly factor BamA